MCYQYQVIKAVNPAAPKRVFVPCGKCEECRASQKSAWSFRLTAEMQTLALKGWHLGFVTLTYNSKSLPHIPKSVFVYPNERRCIPCFSRKHIRTFIDDIRKVAHSEVGLKGLRYMVCAEYGSSTRRPHYHALLAWPPSVDSRYIYSLVERFWTKKGHIIPRKFEGGVDRKGNKHKPFVVDDPIAAARYAAKYCCKDLHFDRSLAGVVLRRDTSLFKNCDCFHLQSKSLGLSALVNLTDEQKLDVLLNGYQFVGEQSRRSVPVYVRNKLIFDYNYIFEGVRLVKDKKKKKFVKQPRRLVRRVANDFFVKHYAEIFEKKTAFYEKLFAQMRTADFWRSRGSSAETSFSLAGQINLCLSPSWTNRHLAHSFLCYYGVDLPFCFDVYPPLQWLSRYSSAPIHYPAPKTITIAQHRYIQDLFSLFFGLLRLIGAPDTEEKELIEKVADFHKSMPYV